MAASNSNIVNQSLLGNDILTKTEMVDTQLATVISPTTIALSLTPIAATIINKAIEGDISHKATYPTFATFAKASIGSVPGIGTVIPVALATAAVTAATTAPTVTAAVKHLTLEKASSSVLCSGSLLSGICGFFHKIKIK